MINKKGSAVLVFLVASILIVSSGLIVTYGVGKSNSENDVSETGLVLLDREEQDTLPNLDFLEGEEENVDDFIRQDIVNPSSSSSGGSSSSSGSSSNSDTTDEEIDLVDDISDSGDVVNDESEDLGISSSKDSNSSSNDDEVDSIVVQSFYNGVCKDESIETAEGPGEPDCKYEDYEQCFDYFTKSTVYACENYWCGTFDIGTDYCIDSDTLNEAWLNCGATSFIRDYLDWEEKDCDDFDGVGGWYYYCTSTQVRKKERDYGCGDGRCKFLGWKSDQLVSKEGYSNYCTKRKEGYNNGWTDCTLCGHGDYECDWSSECYGSLECMGPGILACSIKNCGCCNSGETWDTTRDECCECDDATDPCCDGCHYESSSKVCDYHYGSYYYSCSDGQCLGDDVFKTDRKRYCSGSSSSCSGGIIWNSPLVYKNCYSWSFCDADNAGWSAFSCSTAQCTSGACCDTDCGDYVFKSSASQPIDYVDDTNGFCVGTNDATSTNYVYTRDYYCNGDDEDMHYTNTKEDTCGICEYCSNDDLTCNHYSLGYSCGTKDCDYLDTTCRNYYDRDKFCNSGSCISPSCNSYINIVLGTSCGINKECDGSGSCIDCTSHAYSMCSDNDVYWFDFCDNKEEIRYECGEEGCLEGNCIGCISQDYFQCYDNDVYWFDSCGNREEIKEDCGEDYCEDWQDDYCNDGDVYHERVCYDRGCSTGSCDDTSTVEEQKIQDCDYGCTNGECKKPDLTITSLYPIINSRTVTLVFRIKNLGDAIAENVYWMIDTDSLDTNPERTKSINLNPGEESNLLALMWTYSQSGTYNPKVISDFDNLVDESDEANNEKSISVTV